jgi:SAM-dependent methyltransferase
MSDHQAWARKIIRRWDPAYRPRWEVFDSYLQSLQNPDKVCLDLGSGTQNVLDSGLQFRLKIHSDLILPERYPAGSIPFIQTDIINLPFKNSSIDVILLRFVVEHLPEPDRAFSEIRRVLKPGGQVLILTTNITSPFILIPKWLPYTLRKKMMQFLFKAEDEDIFPTCHRINRKGKIKKLSPQFDIMDWIYLQDANWNRRGVFILFFSWHLLTRWLRLEFLRTNFITVLLKE